MMQSATIFGAVALTLAALRANSNLPGQNPDARVPFPAAVRTHQTRGQWTAAVQVPNAGETAAELEAGSSAPPTRSSFMANWSRVTGANGYLLDVSTSDSFSDFVNGYHDLDVGNVIGRVVSGLNPGITYYYRVRPYTSIGAGSYSHAGADTTVPATGLIINATFDSSITGNPNAAAIEGMINRAISIYESLFTDSVTLQIRFRYATTLPNGDPLPAGQIAHSTYLYYTIPWDTYVNALQGDARTSNDDLANSSLPGTALSPNVNVQSANGRAIGLNTPPNLSANGTIGGPYDGIVTLNSSSPYQFTRPVSAGNYDAQRLTEHEIDEVMGFASRLSGPNPGGDLWPQDLFSWSSAGVRNLTSNSTRYFSINSGVTDIVDFNQDPQGDSGDWLSENCPQSHPYVQNAFACTGQSSDVTATSPEGINLDVIGYDLATPPTPTQEACYPNFTTAEGCDALNSLTSGAGNTALGWQSLFSNTTGSFNTGVGGGALALNNGTSNTAVGTAALLLNTTGAQNTGVGTDVLVFNDGGSSNTATGYFALMNNTTGDSNTAIGSEALTANTSGNNNTAIGNLTLMNSETTSNNVCVGTQAGSGITNASNNIIIGHHSGVHSVFGQESDRCYIDNISGAPVSVATAAVVLVDSDGRLGTVAADGPSPDGASPKGIRPQAIPDAAKQVMLNLQVQEWEATITQRQQQIEILAAQIKEQIAQIHEVNARLEMNKPAAKIIVNKPKAVP